MDALQGDPVAAVRLEDAFGDGVKARPVPGIGLGKVKQEQIAAIYGIRSRDFFVLQGRNSAGFIEFQGNAEQLKPESSTPLGV
jgi:hypothetical protein